MALDGETIDELFKNIFYNSILQIFNIPFCTVFIPEYKGVWVIIKYYIAFIFMWILKDKIKTFEKFKIKL